ncbi:MAG TPA: hypothetical protein PLZ80_06110, partial [Planctomycetota bacterium]|nr:hypothetical protein [Planctomycetota bacterium]
MSSKKVRKRSAERGARAPKGATMRIEGKEYEFPVVVGTEGEKAIDISSLRASTGYITLDEGLSNTGSCESAITFLDGDAAVAQLSALSIEERDRA